MRAFKIGAAGALAALLLALAVGAASAESGGQGGTLPGGGGMGAHGAGSHGGGSDNHFGSFGAGGDSRRHGGGQISRHYWRRVRKGHYPWFYGPRPGHDSHHPNPTLRILYYSG